MTETTATPNRQSIVPYLHYEDGGAAIDFLCRAFGFRERMATRRGDGTLMHGELELGGSRLMLGTPLDDDGKPKRTRDLPRHGTVMCFVDDIDAHYATACEAGATVLSPLETQRYGGRSYSAVDPEGHIWHFSEIALDADA